MSITANKILKYTAFALLTLVLVGLGQLGQFLKLNDDLRLHTINEWVKFDESRKEIAELFITTCIQGRTDYKNRNIEDKPFGVYECGESIGATELVSVIRASDDILKSAAWPLSIIE